MNSKSNQATSTLPHKPIPLRVIFILNALMCILPFIFYLVVTNRGINIGGLEPKYMLYTGLGYILSFAVLVNFIIKRNRIGCIIIFFINILIALPASAYLGILVAIISLLLIFFNNKVKAYFGA